MLFKEIDLSNPFIIITTILIIAVVSFLRYLLFSGAYYYLFFKLFRKRFTNRFLKNKKLKKKQLFKEIYWSSISGLIFGVTLFFCFYLWKMDATLIYADLSKYNFWYVPLSIFLFLFIQDTYYYWLHRWMHLPKVYKFVHLIHHKSIHTSVWTAFSFHPIETIIQSLYFPLIICVLPLHIYAIITVLTIMTISATINHAGVELYPSGKFGKWLKENIIGATHHNYHHTKFNYNYGLYFTFWDKLIKTEFEDKKKS